MQQSGTVLKGHQKNSKNLFLKTYFIILDATFKVKQCQMPLAYTLSQFN